jgi:5-oxopent-3-ene-1,2,5-tricarboxylate decarboxylase/2-hydroxyhepta-2,4-diene-1,7-dioate isomerase
LRIARFNPGSGIVSGYVSEEGELTDNKGRTYDQRKVKWLPPVSPTKIIGLALNYAEHAGELGLEATSDPVLFIKPISSLIAKFDSIVYPSGVKYMHYEAELAVVIDRSARKVSRERAYGYIRGYTIGNDVTVRDYVTNMFRPPVRAKGFDTFCPLGPCLVTRDEIEDENSLEIKTIVNNEQRQLGNTKDLIHKVPELIEFISSFMTLEPEDVILTGTPKGISPVVPGDRIEISIDKLGTLENSIVGE